MAMLFEAGVLAEMAKNLRGLDEKLTEITSLAIKRAQAGEHFLNVSISDEDPLYKPVTRKLIELGYEVKYYPATFQASSTLEIRW